MSPSASLFPIGHIYDLVVADDGRQRAFLPAGLLGAIRLAHPRSPWARRRYPPASAPRERAERRFEDPTRIGPRTRRRLADLIGGRPSEPDLDDARDAVNRGGPEHDL